MNTMNTRPTGDKNAGLFVTKKNGIVYELLGTLPVLLQYFHIHFAFRRDTNTLIFTKSYRFETK